MKGGGWNNPIYRMKGGKPKLREGVTKSNREEEAERIKKLNCVEGGRGFHYDFKVLFNIIQI